MEGDTTNGQENVDEEGGIIPRSLSEKVLMNPLISEIIWKHVHKEDRLTYRLVCRYWKNESQAWFDSQVVHLCSWNCNDPTCKVPSPQKYLEHLTPSAEDKFEIVPFKSYLLEGWDVIYPFLSRKREERNVQAVQLQFWEKCKDSMTSLHLRKCTISQERLVHVIEDLAPNLTCLVLSANNTIVDEYAATTRNHPLLKRLEIDGPVPFSSWYFLELFPHLEHLKLANFSMDGLFTALQEIRDDYDYQQDMLYLTTLDIMDTEQSLNGFVGAHLPLKHLTFRVMTILDKDKLKNILEFCGYSLETLKLFRFPVSNCYTFPTFPFQVCFKQLTSLELWGNMVENLNFLALMPVLKKLRVDVLCYEKREVIQYFSGRSAKLQPSIGDIVGKSNCLMDSDKFGLEEFITDSLITLDGWKKLSRWMPYLTVLHAPLNNETLKFVCSQWMDLRRLKCRFGSDITDEGIIGSQGAGFDGGGLDLLKYLHEFEMEVECGKAKLTDTAAQMTLLRMESLTHLKIYVSPEFTQKTKCSLQEKIHKVKILGHDLENHQQSQDGCLIQNEQLECCQWKDFNKLWNRRQ